RRRTEEFPEGEAKAGVEEVNRSPRVRQSDGTVTMSSQQINDRFSTFYNNLYCSQGKLDDQKFETFLADLNLPQLTEQDREYLEAPLNIQEISRAIKSMPLNKAPGLDGIPLDFYQSFEDILSPLLLDIYNEAFQNGSLPQSITLYSIKKGRIIQIDQSGFIPNRYGSDNTMRLVNLQYHVYNSTQPTIALSLDAAKAFDCVEWEFLFKILGKFGFGSNFIKWIKTLYDKPSACVLTNGLISSLFQLQRSMRQGCWLSPGLFAIAIEPLAQEFCCHTAIHGINMCSVHNKLLLYADDMLFLLTKLEESVPILLDCIEDFTLLSGYKVNWEKSEAMPMSGHCPSSLYKNWRFCWSSKSIKYLGIKITSDYNDMVQMHSSPLIEKTTDFGRWSKIHLSPVGKN
uniref:Reverse transcriptase domain-containing protein n=1 Tax=Cyprinodon variegatus TaxID=28743 RepID=A0A3Q2EIC0_CYPVA